MPELPDVEYFRRYFNATALHQRIARVHVQSPEMLEHTSPQGLGRALKHKSFAGTRRHGKYLFAEVDANQWLVLHFGMTGELQYFQRNGSAPDYTQLLVEFDNGHALAYINPRKLGDIALTEDVKSWVNMKNLGPDALDLDERAFIQLASGRHGATKSWLMDQHTLAGIGNLYSDEILFQAHIHPKTAVKDLDDAALKQIYRKMREVLDIAIDRNAEPEKLPDSFLLPHRHKGGHCPRCGTELKTIKVGGRTAWFCPECQKK